MVEDFVQFIRVLGLDKPFVAGYSDGGQGGFGFAGDIGT
jgi:pimeloyl-ACP methyl ester carboxylesterase